MDVLIFFVALANIFANLTIPMNLFVGYASSVYQEMLYHQVKTFLELKVQLEVVGLGVPIVLLKLNK